jgi:hypothetical protein
MYVPGDTIALPNCELDGNGASNLVQFVHSTITTLDIPGNKIGVEGARALAQFLSSHTYVPRGMGLLCVHSRGVLRSSMHIA